MRLKKPFFENETSKVAHSLIGKVIVKYTDFLGKYYRISGIITETEAYGFNDDPASHAFRRKTNRNDAMFGNVGHVYIYLIYGNHYCLNLVARKKDQIAGAVLIRAIEPLEGINLMKIFRKTGNILNLTTGPGKITQAFRITKKHNNFDLTDEEDNKHFYIEENKSTWNERGFKVGQTTRIGISSGIDKEWRFIMLNKNPEGHGYIRNVFLSRTS